MSRGEVLEPKTRLRIAANLRRLRWRLGFETPAAMAKEIGVTRGHICRLLSGERTPGLDFCILVDRKFGCGLDWLCKAEPPEPWWNPEYVPPGGWT